MKNSRFLTRLLTVLGICLMAGAVLAVVLSQFARQNATRQATQTVAQLQALMPPIHSSSPDDRVNMQMPQLELDGVSYAAIVELPLYETCLPVKAQWSGNVTQCPCRFSGSIYDGSLIIGGSDQPGQLDFMKLITGGDTVYVTDMTGGRYRYTVTDILKTTDVSHGNLSAEDADLVLFARNTYGFDYTVVRCALKTGN